MNDTLILCICTVFILNSTLAHLVCMHTFDEKISIVPLYIINVIIKCFIGTLFECLSMQIQNTCAGVIFLYLIHIHEHVHYLCIDFLLFQSLAES